MSYIEHGNFIRDMTQSSFTAFETFVNGSLCKCLSAWRGMTHNTAVLFDSVSDYKIECVTFPRNYATPRKTRFSDAERSVINAEVDKLCWKNVIDPCGDERNAEFLSTINTVSPLVS